MQCIKEETEKQEEEREKKFMRGKIDLVAESIARHQTLPSFAASLLLSLSLSLSPRLVVSDLMPPLALVAPFSLPHDACCFFPAASFGLICYREYC